VPLSHRPCLDVEFHFTIFLSSVLGIIGNDGRHYILDLLRTFPPDVNFLEVEGIELGKEARALGNFHQPLHGTKCFPKLHQSLFKLWLSVNFLDQRCPTLKKIRHKCGDRCLIVATLSKIVVITIFTWKYENMLKMGTYLHFCPSKVAEKVQWLLGF